MTLLKRTKVVGEVEEAAEEGVEVEVVPEERDVVQGLDLLVVGLLEAAVGHLVELAEADPQVIVRRFDPQIERMRIKPITKISSFN